MAILELSKVSIENARTVRFLASYEEETEEDLVQRSVLLKWKADTTEWGFFPLPWESCSIATRRVPSPDVYVLSVNGSVGHGYGSFVIEELPQLEGRGPEELGPMRDVVIANNCVIACGMGRQVYLQSGGAAWMPLHTPTMIARKDIMEVSGFNSIHALSREEIWAVGFNGEIWQFVNSEWQQHDSPTNLVLHKVYVVGSNAAFAVGQKGQILAYDGRSWSVRIEIEEAADLWDACLFDNKIYVSADTGVFRVDLLNLKYERVSILEAESFGHLDAADGVMWSCGSDALAYTTDGKTWQRVPLPPSIA